jgi:phage baseplate assembly protein W
MSVVISADMRAVDWDPATEAEEVIQNVRTILRTLRNTVPLDRDFGVSGRAIDMPVQIAAAVYEQSVIEAVNTYEPRAEVVRVDFADSEGLDGFLNPVITVNLRLGNA